MATDRNGRTISIGDDYIPVARVVGIVSDTCVQVDTGRAMLKLDASRIAYQDQLGGGGGGATTLAALTDVSIPSPSSGQVLSYNGSLWVAVDPAAGGDLGDLDDVTITTPAAQQVLTWNGSAWVNDDLPDALLVAQNLGDLDDASAARTNLGLGDSATKDTGTGAGTVAAGDHAHTLADVTDSGGAAALNVGTTAGTVAAGDHVHASHLTTSSSIGDLADVTIGALSGGEVLEWSGSAWVPTTLPVPMLGANNLSELTSAATGRTNLGLGDSAVLDVGTTAGTVAAGDHGHTLADVSDSGTAAAADIGTGAGQVAAGDHTHTLAAITDAGDAAAKNTGTTAGTVAAGDHGHTLADVSDSGALAALDGLDLGDLDDVTIGTLLGGEHVRWNSVGGYWESFTPSAYAPLSHTHTLANVTDSGDAAGKDVGTGSGDVAAGDHGHADLDALQTDGVPVHGHRHPWRENFASIDHWSGAGGGSGTQVMAGPGTFSWLSGSNSVGFLRLTCGGGTASTDYRTIRPDNIAAGSIDYDASATKWIVGWRVALNNSTNIKARVGLWKSTVTGTSEDAGFWFDFDTAANSNVLCAHNDGTTTYTTSSGETVASFSQTLRWCELQLSSAGCVFRIDGTTVATITTNLPSGADSILYPMGTCAGAGTTWRSLVIDTYEADSAGSDGSEDMI